MDPNTTERRYTKFGKPIGRPTGSKNRRQPFCKEPLPLKKRDMFWGCYTTKEWQERFMELSPEKQFDILARLEPKDVKVEGHTSSSLVVEGLNRHRAIQSPVEYVSPAELPPATVNAPAPGSYHHGYQPEGGGIERPSPPAPVQAREADTRVQDAD